MKSSVLPITLTAALAFASAAQAQEEAVGAVADGACQNLVANNVGSGGELYALKVHNPGSGPDEHTDWLFDLRAKGGAQIPNVDAGGATYQVLGRWKHHPNPPEHLFVIMTFPDGNIAIDGQEVRSSNAYGAVERQQIGSSLGVGTAAGIGLDLPGSAAQYEISSMVDTHTGAPARFPFGTRQGIEVAFAPIAEVNPTELAPGCTIGSEAEDPEARFGLIVGYNVYRIPGDPGIVPAAVDFIGGWNYYIPYSSFDTHVPDTYGSAGPDMNGDGLPDGDGTDAPTDANADGDLVGLHNPNGVPYDGDEVLIFQDSARNPDGSPRAYGTAPDVSGAQGYWYAFQPVLFSSTTTLADYDGLGFTRDDMFVGQHALDVDGNGQLDALDFDLDGSPEIYSPQAEQGILGYGLTNNGLPLLSPPVFGRANPAFADGGVTLAAKASAGGADLTLSSPYETGDITGYDVYRLGAGDSRVRVTAFSIDAVGSEAAIYQIKDRRRVSPEERLAGHIVYVVEVHHRGGISYNSRPFVFDIPSPRRSR